MSQIDVPKMCGACELTPDGPVVAGSYGTWTLAYTAGEWGIDDGGTLMIAWRFPTDWGRPQFDDPTADDYMTVTTDSNASLVPRFDMKAYVRPWRKAVIIDVFDDGILPGEQIVVTYGDTIGGSRGARAQTFCEYTFEFRVLVNPIATGLFTRLPDSPEIEIVPGPAAAIKAIAPTGCQPGDDVEIAVKFEDECGNPTPHYDGGIEIDAPEGLGLPASVTFEPDETGLMKLPATVPDSGIYRVGVSAAGDMEALSNPIECQDDYALNRYWGDLHGQSEETVGTNTVEDYYRFGRDQARLDCCSHQGNDFQITEQYWDEFNRQAEAFNKPGEFVTLPGYEWSGNSAGGGDHNVWYRHSDPPIYRSSHALIPDKADLDTDRFPIEELYKQLRHEDAVVGAHVGGRRATLERHDDDVMRIVELYCAWGQFEWMLTESLELGHVVGVVANSDGHKGRPGASYPGESYFGCYGGLTCLYASELTRDGIFEALRDRRCYGTSGERIIVRFSGSGLFMGQMGPPADTSSLRFHATIHGTAPIEAADLFKKSTVVASYDGFGDLQPSNRLRVKWSGARILGRDRATHWDGGLALRGNRILDAEPWAFDSLFEQIFLEDDATVRWRSITTGDADGVILTLQENDEGSLHFDAGPAEFELPLDELDGLEPFVYEAGGIDQKVTVRRLPATPPPLDVDLQLHPVIADTRSGAYWLRVRQIDGATAWTSPVYITD